MSFQVFLHGKILGIKTFLVEGPAVEGRASWASLLSEVLPRALLAELGLSPMLLGASGGGQFLVVIPVESRLRAEEFCLHAASRISEYTGGTLRLVWAATENLGDWSDIRKRLSDEMQERMSTPLTSAPPSFHPFDVPAKEKDPFAEFQHGIHDAASVGWSAEEPGFIVLNGGKHVWPLSQEGIPLARHTALDKDGSTPARLATLARRSVGRKTWGVLMGDVDNSSARLRRMQNIEEHLQLTMMYKQFFAAELQMRCSLPEFFRKVSLLWTGADDFAVCGSWDALIPLAREVQRLFSVFADASLQQFAGLEGKTISMAVALAPDGSSTLAGILEDAMRNLEIAKSEGKDGIYIFGRTLEWKQLADAAETRMTMTRLIAEFGCSPQFLHELAGFYIEAEQSGVGFQSGRRRQDRLERPWRFHRRLNTILGSSGNREFQKLRTDLVADFAGRRAKQIRLRPQGRVALEWARLETE